MLKNLGKYEIVAELGQGAMGVVYKARDPLIGRMVALKTITSGLSGKPELLERFYQEARSAGALQHPNIVTIFELGKEGETPYIAMEFLEGDSLEKIVSRRDALPLSKKIGFMAQICSALDYAHKHGVIHRDIKPGNIMLTKDGTVKVVDFGIARLVDTSKTQTGLMIGTPAYMSPQLLRGERADERADIWALGVMLYELIAYQRPFLGDNPAALMWNIISQNPKPLCEVAPACPEELQEIVGKMLEKEAPLRLQTMEDVLLELDPLYKKLQRDRMGELVAESRQLIENQDLQSAAARLREALYLDSSNAEAKTLLDKVSTDIRRIQTQARAKEQVAKAQALFDGGRLEEARSEADVALRMDAKFEPAVELAARVKAAIDRIKRLQEALQQAKQNLAAGGLAEADKLVDEALGLEPANQQALTLRKQIREETARRERRKRVDEGLQHARAAWSQQQHLRAVEILSVLQREFPQEGEIGELLVTVQHDQAEQEKQELLAEARNLMAAQRYDEALAALEAVRTAYPGDAAIRHLTGIIQQEQQAKAKRQRFESELASLRTKVSESQWNDALRSGESLLREYPSEFELIELMKFVRGEMQRAEQKRAFDERVAQVRALVDAGSFAQAIKAAEKALAEAPGNVDLTILLDRAQTQQKEQEKRETLEKRIREVKARINRDDLTDAVDLARQTLVTLGPDTDITQLLHAAEMEISQRERKKEQDKQIAAAKTLIGSGDFAGATQVIDQATSTQILDAGDPRVQQVLNDLRETQERQKREKDEEERKKKQAAAEKKAAEKKAAEAKKQPPAAAAPPKETPKKKEDKGGSAPATPAAPAWPPPSSGDPGKDYVYQQATMIPGGPSAATPAETVQMEAASATMISSGAIAPATEIQPAPTMPSVGSATTIGIPTIGSATTVGDAAAFGSATTIGSATSIGSATTIGLPADVAAESKRKKKKRGTEAVLTEVRVEPMAPPAEPPVERVAPPIWKQPVPLAIGGLVLAAVLGITIYKVSSTPSSGVTPGGSGVEQPAANAGSSSGSAAIAPSALPATQSPLQTPKPSPQQQISTAQPQPSAAAQQRPQIATQTPVTPQAQTPAAGQLTGTSFLSSVTRWYPPNVNAT